MVVVVEEEVVVVVVAGQHALPAKPPEDEEAHEVALPVVRLDAGRLVEGTQRLGMDGRQS